jgi:Flp pilus assembly protein TadG
MRPNWLGGRARDRWAERSAGLARILTGFGRDQSGTIIIPFCLAFAVVLFAIGMAIDFGRAEHERMQMQWALDAAALAAAHQLGLPDQDEKSRAAADAYFRVNSPEGTQTHIDSITLDADKGELTLTSGGPSLTTLLNAFGISSLNLGASSKVSKGDGTVEVALVLDNSGSMAGQYIEDLKTAATNLIGVVFAGAQDDKVKVGVIPFAGSVNVGPEMRDSGWIDTSAAAPTHVENFAEARSRFDLLSQMSVDWRGCVEARPAPYDTQDTEPNAAVPATLFVPMFAPDEPDSGNDNGDFYNNNYLDDFGGSCPPQPQVCVNWSTRQNRCRQWGPQPLDPATAQARTCKYDGATVYGAGPNANCTTAPILPLTSNKADAEAAVTAMLANGNTNIAEGAMWGWRVLSPEVPFTEGRPWDDRHNQKVMVLMTDGENTYQAYSNHNRSVYGAFGYAAKGRLGTTYSQSALVSEMNAKTTAACNNAKAQGVVIYTVAFRLESNPSTQALLQGCASGADKAYRASDGAALIQTFQIIGREIAQLRVSS